MLAPPPISHWCHNPDSPANAPLQSRQSTPPTEYNRPPFPRSQHPNRHSVGVHRQVEFRNYLKTAIATAGDTRAARKPVAAGPSSWKPATRSAPVSPDIWTASPKSVPPPNAAPESVSYRPGPTSPPQCAGYAADTRRPSPRCDQWDCHIPCPSTGGEPRPRRLPGAPLRCAPGLAPAVWHQAHWPRTQQRSRGRLAPGRWGWGQWHPPKRALPMAQSADCHAHFMPPNSAHSAAGTARMRGKTPHCTQHWRVRWMALSSPSSRGKWFHWSPLRSRKMMDAVEHQPGVGALAAGGFGGIQCQDYGADLLPEMVWNFPDGFQCRVAARSQPPVRLRPILT